MKGRMRILMNDKKDHTLVLDQEKANVRPVAGCEVQTIPKRMMKRSVVRKMLTEAYLFLEVKNGELVIEIRRPKEGELFEG